MPIRAFWASELGAPYLGLAWSLESQKWEVGRSRGSGRREPLEGRLERKKKKKSQVTTEDHGREDKLWPG